MELLLAGVIGALFATATYALLRPGLLRVIFGFILLTNGVNLLVLAVGRSTSGVPPLVPPGAEAAPDLAANPLPQALVLTAIVIGFGLISFSLVLATIARRALGDPDLTSPPPDEPDEPGH